MDNQPAFDRSLLIPIIISGCSIIGILGVLVLGRWLNAPPQVAMTPSATRFQYVYLGTEPVITTPLIEETEVGPTEPVTGAPEEPTQGSTTPGAPATPTRSTPPTLIILGSPTNNPEATNTPTVTLTSASGPPLNPGIYDDIYPQIIYNGWEATNAGSTLHVSTQPGSSISFRFIGTELRLLYQGGPSLGQIRITIDNAGETLDQSSGSEWVSDQFPDGTHTVQISHSGGGAVNLDQIIVRELVNTPTPTATSTQNQ
jgi:hypothetical protein